MAYHGVGEGKRGYFYRAANFCSKPIAVALASWIGSEAYKGITEDGFAEWAGKGLDSIGWLENSLAGLEGYEATAMKFVNKIPLVGEYVGRFVDFCMPTDGQELAILTSLAVAGGILVNQGVKFAKDPFGYIGKKRELGRKKWDDFTSGMKSGSQSTYTPHPWQATKKATRYVWDTTRHAYINIPALMLNNWVANGLGGVGERLRGGTENYLESADLMKSAGKVLEMISDYHPVLDILTPTADQVARLGGSLAEATPWIVTGTAVVAGGKLLQGATDQKIRDGIDKAGLKAKDLVTEKQTA